MMIEVGDYEEEYQFRSMSKAEDKQYHPFCPLDIIDVCA